MPKLGFFLIMKQREMGQITLLNSPQDLLFATKLSTFKSPKLNNHRPCWVIGEKYFAHLLRCHTVQSPSQATSKVVIHVETSLSYKEYSCSEEDSETLPYVQTLRKFPRKDLFDKVVLVRFDSSILLTEEADQIVRSASDALFTIKYLSEAGAKIVLVSDWNVKRDSKLFDSESVADSLTFALNIKVVPVRGISLRGLLKTKAFDKADIILLDSLLEFKEEVSNCPKFSEMLSSSVDIFVNDSFSQSHKILSSNVGVTRFCYACLAGFHFEKSINQLRNINETERKPYVTIIGGGKILDKPVALQYLASRCDELVFIGVMAFQIMQVLGLSIPSNLVERGTLKEATDIVRFAQSRNVKLRYPKDFLCQNEHLPTHLKIFPSHGIVDGWVPVDIGPESLDEITSLLTRCKKILWIGPVKFHKTGSNISRASKLAQSLSQLCHSGCNVTVVGNKVCEALMNSSSSFSNVNMLYNASVVWEFLKGRKLPGVEALDRAYPYDIDWKSVFLDPSKPLVVDIGSGNGLFLLGMAKRKKDLNYLGLEINKKLVPRCLDSVQRSNMRNAYFIATNATSTFRSIVSSYPGKLVQVSIQCPNPDFNNPENRWRMLRQSLIEAIIELLSPNGKVFLQSDLEAVSLRMKHEFLKHGNGKLAVHKADNAMTSQGWLEENPFGVRSDWEWHVLDRGSPMYRLMLSKLETSETNSC